MITTKIGLGIRIAFNLIKGRIYINIRRKVDQYCHEDFKNHENSICDLDIEYPNGSSCKKDREVSVAIEVKNWVSIH